MTPNSRIQRCPSFWTNQIVDEILIYRLMKWKFRYLYKLYVQNFQMIKNVVIEKKAQIIHSTVFNIGRDVVFLSALNVLLLASR